MPSADAFVQTALTVGPTYHFGGGCNCRSSSCNGGDCSELVKWAACRNGVTVPDGTWIQYRAFRSAGLATTPERAIRTRGAVLFIFSSSPLVGGRPSQAHVAISLGNGTQSIECRSTASGCGVFSNISHRGWTHAALIPGLDYTGTAGVDQGGAGGTASDGTPAPPSLEWKPPTPVGPPPSPPPPPPAPVGTPVYSSVPDEIDNILNSKACGKRVDAYMFHKPYGNTAEIWIGNGILRAYVSATSYPGLAQRGIKIITLSTEEFDSMLDVSGW
jgi:hypothetical protein